MPCYKPLQGYRSRVVNPKTGRRGITFDKSQAFVDLPVEVPCQQCIGCRLERSRQWAIRCVHEASLYDWNCFLTLTYADEFLPPGGSLVLKHFQDFMKRLRFRKGPGVRFFHCGEYGEKLGRPHYHACLFNCHFPDQVVAGSRNGETYYESAEVSELWPFGIHRLGEVTFESAAYVARYCTKKVTGPDEGWIDPRGRVHLGAALHYNEVDLDTGEILSSRRPEYATMSRRPGIGRGWFDQWAADTYKDDKLILRGRVMRPPKAYDNLFGAQDPEYSKVTGRFTENRKLKEVKNLRKKRGKEAQKRGLNERLEVREQVQLLRAGRLKRGYENG